MSFRTFASNASKPLVCRSMNSTSSTRLPFPFAASSAAKTCLHMPTSTAMSPPGRTWWYCALIRVSPPRQHLERVLRVDEDLEPLLPHGIEGDDRHASLGGVLQRMEEARAVRSGVLAEEEHRVALLKVVEDDRPNADADQSSSAPPRWSRGTCWSCRADCCCRTAAQTARRDRTSRGSRGRTHRR